MEMILGCHGRPAAPNSWYGYDKWTTTTPTTTPTTKFRASGTEKSKRSSGLSAFILFVLIIEIALWVYACI
jgi:hypothetical protein